MRSFLKISAALFLIFLIVFPASAGTVSLPSFYSFVWGYIPSAQVQKNASYTIYAWDVSPNVGKTAVLEYMDVLVSQYSAAELARAEDEAIGDITVGYSIPACAEKGFRTTVGDQAIRGCHVLLIWKSNLAVSGGGTLYLYLNRGVDLADTGVHSAILPTPTPRPTPAPMPKPQPTPVSTYDPNPWPTATKGKCTYCNGKGTRDCLTCDGKGYVEYSGYVPNYGGGGGGSYHERKDCPNIFCNNGQVDCPFCGGTGQR